MVSFGRRTTSPWIEFLEPARTLREQFRLRLTAILGTTLANAEDALLARLKVSFLVTTANSAITTSSGKRNLRREGSRAMFDCSRGLSSRLVASGGICLISPFGKRASPRPTVRSRKSGG